jgi:hypothetical protein
LKRSSQFLSNFTNGLITLTPMVCDPMIREALNVILHNAQIILKCRILRQLTFAICFLSKQMAGQLGVSGQSLYGDTSRVLLQPLKKQISAVYEMNDIALHDMFV